MDRRHVLIDDYLSGMFSKKELAERAGVSRPTIDLWIARFEALGREGLADRSSAPHNSPRRTAADVEQLILATRRKHPSWGAKKLRQYLELHRSQLELPARSTINDILDRHGELRKQVARRSDAPRGRTAGGTATAANERWCLDFKGQFLLGNHRYCYPLTVSDEHSRYLLLCHALSSTEGAPVRRQLERLFAEHGLPERIRSDNGSPFAGIGLWGLSRLNVWWTTLGIIHQPSRRGCPQDNGRHERMHRTLKAEATRPPEQTMPRQQRRFDGFRHEYNDERPHEALDGLPPARLWQPSPRALPATIPGPEYPGHYEVRRVGGNGTIKFKNEVRFLSGALDGNDLGLEEIDDGIWSIWLYHRLLGRLELRSGIIR